MAMKLRHRKTVIALSAGLGSLLIGVVIYVGYQTDRAREDLDRAADVKQRCTRLRLTMTRDEVIQLMGQPLKEYDVRPEGKGGPAIYKELLFNMPMSSQPAYTDFDLDTSRVVEISCNRAYTISLPLIQRAQLKAQENRPLPSDRNIPSVP
jgi:hypothetical protein